MLPCSSWHFQGPPLTAYLCFYLPPLQIFTVVCILLSFQPQLEHLQVSFLSSDTCRLSKYLHVPRKLLLCLVPSHLSGCKGFAQSDVHQALGNQHSVHPLLPGARSSIYPDACCLHLQQGLSFSRVPLAGKRAGTGTLCITRAGSVALEVLVGLQVSRRAGSREPERFEELKNQEMSHWMSLGPATPGLEHCLGTSHCHTASLSSVLQVAVTGDPLSPAETTADRSRDAQRRLHKPSASSPSLAARNTLIPQLCLHAPGRAIPPPKPPAAFGRSGSPPTDPARPPCSHCSSAHPAGPGSLPQKPAGTNAPSQPLLTPEVDGGEPEAAPGPAATSSAEPSGPTQPGAHKISGKRATSMAPKHRADRGLQPCTAVLQVQRLLLKKLSLHSHRRGNEKGRPKTA